ncbi:MAG: NUDIX domain-containing protein [Pseudomonadota bacterium]
MTNSQPDNLFPAATVVLIRERDALEVLLLRRNSKLAFHGGSWVFPGGRVDHDDIGTATNDAFEPAARRAAVREASEEAGVVISPDELVFFSHWTTPVGRPKRFSTWFFIAGAPDQAVTVDGGEIHAYQWMSARSALDAQAAGDIELPAPTYVTLLKLAPYQTVRDAIAGFGADRAEYFVPRYHKLDDGACSVYEEDAGYADGNLDVPGARHRLYMQQAGWRYLRDWS